MKLDQKIVEAAKVGYADERARRVLKAASECVPNEVVRTALKAAYGRDDFPNGSTTFVHMEAAISAGLAEWAEGE